MLAGFSQTGKPRHWWSCKMLDVRRSMWRILTKSKEKNGLPNQVIDLEFGEGGLYWQSSWSPRMSQSLTLNDQLLFSSPQFNCLKDCISCELIDISHDDEKKVLAYTVLSSLQVAKVSPDGWKATELTSEVWPHNIWVQPGILERNMVLTFEF